MSEETKVPENKTKEKKLISNLNYLNKLADIKIRVPAFDEERGVPDYRGIIKNYAEQKGMKVNQLVITLINESMLKDGIEIQIPSGITEIKRDSL